MRFSCDDIRWCSDDWDDILNLEILKKKIHPSHVPYRGRILEVKNPKNFTPKVVLDPNSIFKSHHFDHDGLSGRLRRLDPVTWTYLGSEGLFERDFDISKKILHPWDAPYGGMFLEVKIPKNRTPKVVFHPSRIFKSHHFVVMFLIHSYIHSSRQTIGPQDTFYVTYY